MVSDRELLMVSNQAAIIILYLAYSDYNGVKKLAIKRGKNVVGVQRKQELVPSETHWSVKYKWTRDATT